MTLAERERLRHMLIAEIQAVNALAVMITGNNPQSGREFAVQQSIVAVNRVLNGMETEG